MINDESDCPPIKLVVQFCVEYYYSCCEGKKLRLQSFANFFALSSLTYDAIRSNESVYFARGTAWNSLIELWAFHQMLVTFGKHSWENSDRISTQSRIHTYAQLYRVFCKISRFLKNSFRRVLLNWAICIKTTEFRN